MAFVIWHQVELTRQLQFTLLNFNNELHHAPWGCSFAALQYARKPFNANVKHVVATPQHSSPNRRPKRLVDVMFSAKCAAMTCRMLQSGEPERRGVPAG